LLVGTLPGVELDDQGWWGLTDPLSNHVPFRREIARADARGKLLRDLLGRWCLTARSEQALWSACWQVLVHGLTRPGHELARRSLGHDSPQVLAGTACVLGHHGQEEDIPRLLPLLRRHEYYLPNLWGIEVADVALEALVRLTGQKVGDYGV